jgi:tetratricopeptide (TPR) repeat protein
MTKLINWVLGVALWFAGIAEKILFWFLRNWAYFFGLGAAGLVLISHWVALTISDRISGLHAPLLGYVVGKPGGLVSLVLSWGAAAAVLLLAAAVTYSRKHWRCLAISGAGLLLLCLAGLLQLAFCEADLLKEVGDEELDFVAIQQFENHYLPINYGKEASNAQGPEVATSIVTAWDRVVTARFFMGRGWYLTLGAGIGAFFYAKKRLTDRRQRSLLVKVTLLAAFCLWIGFSLRPTIAEITVAHGQDAEAKGQPDLAIARYRRAMRLDKWYAIHTDLYQRIGAIDFNFGRTDTIDYGIFFAELMVSQNNLTGAVQQYERLIPRAEKISAQLADVVKTREADIWTLLGKELYAHAAIGAAVQAWENAVAKDQSQWLATFGLCRGYFETGRYQRSVDWITSVIKRVRDPETRANLESNLGDAYTRLDELALAHLAYRRSYLIDYVLNWRGLSDLIGAQNQVSLQDSDK